jgi:hypothetical protein
MLTPIAVAKVINPEPKPTYIRRLLLFIRPNRRTLDKAEADKITRLEIPPPIKSVTARVAAAISKTPSLRP